MVGCAEGVVVVVGVVRVLAGSARPVDVGLVLAIWDGGRRLTVVGVLVYKSADSTSDTTSWTSVSFASALAAWLHGT